MLISFYKAFWDVLRFGKITFFSSSHTFLFIASNSILFWLGGKVLYTVVHHALDFLFNDRVVKGKRYLDRQKNSLSHFALT